MIQIGLIGLGAGAAAALLFASIASGSLLAIALFYLAPLPILIAGIGWSHWTAAIATATAALALAATLGSVFFFAFLVGTGGPAWLLGYLAMLARPASSDGHQTLEWYPPGRLVLWCAGLATLVVIVAIINFGSDLESFRSGLRRALERMIVIGLPPSAAPDTNNTGRMVEFLISAIPPGAAVLATITNALNLWLALRVVKFSSLLRRPWPNLAAMEFPAMASIALALAIALSFIGGLVGIVATSLMAALLMAYAVLGFAVLHTLTVGMSGRTLILGGVYAAVVILGWPALALCLLGLLEAALSLRRRFANKHGPPPTSGPTPAP